jgi:acetoin utilization deacetylase AcuC-like enzyme
LHHEQRSPFAGTAPVCPPVPAIFDDRYCVEAAPSLSTTKQVRVVRAVLAEGLVDLRPAQPDLEAAWADIARVHLPEYVAAVRTGEPRRLAESQGFRWSPAFADSVARIWAGHVAACRLALTEGLVVHPVSGAHHAVHAHGGGFCTFNFLVGAARELRRDGLVTRVAVIDLDAHQGNGTWEFTTGDERIGAFDVSSSDWGCSSRGAHEVYRVVNNARQYIAALEELPAFLDAFAPDLVQYQAGVDCHEHDPLGAVDGLSESLMAERDRRVLSDLARRGIPTVVNLAGGYQPDGTTERLHVQTIRVAGEEWRRALKDAP